MCRLTGGRAIGPKRGGPYRAALLLFLVAASGPFLAALMRAFWYLSTPEPPESRQLLKQKATSSGSPKRAGALPARAV
jgi:hypothetical protein